MLMINGIILVYLISFVCDGQQLISKEGLMNSRCFRKFHININSLIISQEDYICIV